MTPPMGPVALIVAGGAAGSSCSNAPSAFPELTIPSPPQGETAAVREAARLLVNAERPLIQIAKIGRTPKAWDLMIELAETLQAPVQVGYQRIVAEVSVVASAVRHRRPRLHAGRARSASKWATCRPGARPRARAAARRSASRPSICSSTATSTTTDTTPTSIWRSPPTPRRRCRRSSRRSSGSITPEQKSAIAGARRARRRGAQGRRSSKAIEDGRYGWDASPVSVPRMLVGARRSNQERRLGHRLRPSVHGRLAAAAAEPRQALALQRRLRRVRHRLRRAGIGRRRARAQEGGPPVRSASSATAT